MTTPIRGGFAVSLFLATVMAVASIGPAVSGEPPQTAPSITALQPAHLKAGDLVRPLSGGPVMRVRAVKGDTVICDVGNGQSAHTKAEFPIAQLALVTGSAGRSAPLLEPQPYRPCPADVVMPDGRHACLG